MKYGLKQLRKDFPTDQKCLQFAFDTLHSRECGCGGVYKRVANRNAFYCTKCRKQVHPLAQTIFRRSLVPLRDWFRAMLLIHEGMSIAALGKELGIGYKTAWRVVHTLRQATHNDTISVCLPNGKSGTKPTKKGEPSTTKHTKTSTVQDTTSKNAPDNSVCGLRLFLGTAKEYRSALAAEKHKSGFYRLTI